MLIKSLKMLTLVVVCILLIASLVRCAPSDKGEATPVEPTEVVEKETPEEATPVEPTEEAKEETSIVIAISADPAGFNAATNDMGNVKMVMEMSLLGMAEIDPYGNVFPELAAELPTLENGGVVIDEDAGTMDVTWKMRDDVFWADGEPVTADDVAFTWEAITDPEGGVWVQGVDYTDSVEKVDDYTFVVHYNSIYPNYLTQFGGEDVAIWPEHYCDAGQSFVSWDCNREPLSNGPYILEEWDAGDHLTFIRNPTYFEEGKPYIDRIVARIVPEQAVRTTMMIKGDADACFYLTVEMMDELKDKPNTVVSFSPTSRWVMRLIPNLAAKGSVDPKADPHPILSDVRVRQAIRMAIDVDTITEKIIRGDAKPVWTELFRPPYICDIPKPEYDPEGAATLLEDAGWTDEDGDGVRECHGCLNAEEDYPMSMEFMIYAEYGEALELAQQLIAEMLGKIGFDLQLTMEEGGIMWADYESGGIEQRGNFDLDMWDDGYPGIDPTDHLWSYYHSEAGKPDYGYNVGRWSNEDFDALLDGVYTLDEEHRQELFCQMAEILDEELPQILLWSAVDAAAYSTRVEGVQATANDILTWNVADWKVAK